MSIIKVEKHDYTAEPLYQWDLNQSLVIHGLSIFDPEIHFSNEMLVRTIPGACTVDTAGVITARVPNSLLQKPYTLVVYICGYEGESFKTFHKIRVPVKARPQPADYTLELSDDEVYSFQNLSKKVEDLEATVGTEARATYFNYTPNITGEALIESTKTTTVVGYSPFISQSLQAIKTVIDNLKSGLNNSIDTLQKRTTPIEYGGTGATTAEEAVANLGVYKWETLGSIALDGSQSIETLLPCDEALMDEYEHFRYTIKKGARLSVYIEGTNANYVTTGAIAVNLAGQTLLQLEVTAQRNNQFEYELPEDLVSIIPIVKSRSIKCVNPYNGSSDIIDTRDYYDIPPQINISCTSSGPDVYKFEAEYSLIVELQGKR